MKKISFVVVVALCVCLWGITPAWAQILKAQAVETPKGINLWVIPDTKLPIISMSFAFRGGAAADPADKQGATILMTSVLDEGAGDMTANAFQAALRDRAISLSFSAGRDAIFGDMQTLTRHKQEAVRLLTLAINSPRFDVEAVARMRDAHITRLKASLSDADWAAARLLNDVMYQGHGYALNTGGTLQTLAALGPTDARAARAKRFARDRLVVAIAGDITVEDAKTLVDSVFGALPISSDCPMLPDIKTPLPDTPVFYAKDVPQTYLSMAWTGIDRRDPDYAAALVMNHIFGGGSFSSRLMSEIREKKGLTYGISSGLSDLVHADRLTVSASLLPGNVAPTLSDVQRIASDLIKTDVTADELAIAKDYLRGSMVIALSSTGRISDTALSLMLDRVDPIAIDTLRTDIAKVTAADIRRVAARVFAAKPAIALVGAKPEAVPGIKTIPLLPNAEKVTVTK